MSLPLSPLLPSPRPSSASPAVPSFLLLSRCPAVCSVCVCAEHFIYFVSEFKLIETKELQPLQDLIATLMGKEGAKGAGAPEGAAGSAAASSSPASAEAASAE